MVSQKIRKSLDYHINELSTPRSIGEYVIWAGSKWFGVHGEITGIDLELHEKTYGIGMNIMIPIKESIEE